jgi:hypothetical protein
MGGVVKAVTGGGSKPAPAPTPAPAAPEPVRATKAETQSARERQAAFRARRGSGASLMSYDRTLGGQSSLQGEDM